MVIIVKAEKENLSDIIKITLKEIYDDSEDKLARKFVENSFNGAWPFTQCFVARENKDVIGFIIWKAEDLYSNEFVLEIDLMAVIEANQRSGIGSMLIEETLSTIKESFNITKEIEVTVMADDKGAKKFYRKILNPYFESKEPFNRTHFYAKL